MAVLEAFVYDPLLNWRLVASNNDDKKFLPNKAPESPTKHRQEFMNPIPKMSFAMRTMYHSIQKVIQEELQKNEEEYGIADGVMGITNQKKKS